MAANLDHQASVEGARMVPSLIQELAAGNFHEGREPFHDNISSKFMYGEDTSNNQSVTNPSASIFPGINLTSSCPDPRPVLGHGSGTNSHTRVENVGSSNSAGEGSKAFHNPSLSRSLTAQKSDISKRKIPRALHGGREGPSKVKKKNVCKKEKNNVCNVCGRGFAEKYTLSRHMLTHTRIKPYSCSKCNMSFARTDGLAKHMASGHRRVDAHHCDVCGGTFSSELSFEQHRREYGSTLPFVCNLCMLAFSQCCHLNYHMKSHPLSKMNDGFGYDEQDDKSNVIDLSELIPDDCNPPKKDQHKISMVELMNTLCKTGVGNMGKSHHSLNALDPNIVIKPEIEDFSTCNAINNQMYEDPNIVIKPEIEDFSTCNAINNQMYEDPNIVIKPEIEDFSTCNAINNQIYEVNAIHRSGTSNTSFEGLNSFSLVTPAASHDFLNPLANKAGNNLTADNSLSASSYMPAVLKDNNLSDSNKAVKITDSEMRKHCNIKVPIPKFKQMSDLLANNAGEDGLFRCERCGKGFTRKYHMQRHVKLHIRGPIPRAHLLDWTRRPYACGVCKMGFTRQHHLTRHILIHTGERPHSCHICGKAFRRFTNLSLHIRTVHGAEKPFHCDICGRGFPRLYSLQRHLKLHVKKASALSFENNDQYYEEFKAVGTVTVERKKSPTYLLANPSNIKQSPNNNQESVSSIHSGDGDKYTHEVNAQVDNLGHTDPGGNCNTMSNQENFAFLLEKSRDFSFHPQNDQHSQNRDQTTSCHPGQVEDRQGQTGLQQQQVLSLPDSDNKDQQNRLAGPHSESITHQNPVLIQASNDFTSPHHGEVINSHISFQVRNSSDFNSQQPMQNLSNDRLISTGSLSSQNLNMLSMSVGGNFSELDIREASSYSQNQQGGGADEFSFHRQQIQSPLPLMNMLERPGSRSMICQTGVTDTYHHSSASYNQAPSSLQIQQHSNMNLSVTCSTLSPANMQDHVSYSHSSICDPNAYSHNHNVSSVPFHVGNHGGYQHNFSDNLNQVDMHPHPPASPLPVSSHNMQY